jgi:protocatechuate 3,4-dioxygenase beta subunit
MKFHSLDTGIHGARRSRRDVLALFGAGAAALLAACQNTSASPRAAPGTATSAQRTAVATTGVSTQAAAETPIVAAPACTLTPQQTEGPYFVDEKLNRSDLRSDPSDGSVKEGVPLRLTLRVFDVGGSACTPLAGAIVDVWHCDALGIYSDVRDPSFGSTLGKKFLRGYQQTDAQGAVTFTTIYPGWYQGRAVHIHFKVRTDPNARTGRELTSQLYFDDALSDQIFAQPPYSQKGQNRLRNSGDGIFRNGGDQLLLRPVRDGQGYVAMFDIGLRTA